MPNGSLYGWGRNAAGELDQGFASNAFLVPTRGRQENLNEVASGGEFALFLHADGTIRGLGNQAVGAQLGDGTGEQRVNPVNPGLSNIVQISAHGDHSTARDASGHIWSWGDNNFGMVGNGTSLEWNSHPERRGKGQSFEAAMKTPFQVPGISTATYVCCGPGTVAVVLANGHVMMWGENLAGQLGDGTVIERPSPTEVPGVTKAVKVVLGGHSAEASVHTLCLLSDGTVMSWGANGQGQLGNGKEKGKFHSPALIPGLTEVIDVAAGALCSFALKANGDLYAWGNQWQGRLGNGVNDPVTKLTESTNVLSPTSTIILKDVSAVEAVCTQESGWGYGQAIKEGRVFSWGSNYRGECGDGTKGKEPKEPTPGLQEVSECKATPVEAIGISNVVQVSPGGNFALAITSPSSTTGSALDEGLLDVMILDSASSFPIITAPKELKLVTGEVMTPVTVTATEEPEEWKIEDGPPGITVSNLGVISGTPTGTSKEATLVAINTFGRSTAPLTFTLNAKPVEEEEPPVEEPKEKELPTPVGSTEVESRAGEEEINRIPVNVPITENFLRRNMANFDAFQTSERELLQGQRHVDIRTFAKDANEKWSVGTEGILHSFSNYPGIEVSVANGVLNRITSLAAPVDLLTGFEPTDYIIFTLPKFPLAAVKLSESYIELTGGPTTVGELPKVRVLLSESLTPLVNGNAEFRVHRSAFEKEGLDLSKVTGVVIAVKGTASATVYYSGMRLIASTWKYASIDYDNWNGRWRSSIPPAGVGTPVAMPIAWRSATPAGENDPRPIDASIGVILNTGAQSAANSFNVYLRGATEAFITQLDLENPPFKTQAKLDGRPQPDLGISEFEERDVSSLDGVEMHDLDLDSMRDLQDIENPTFNSYINLGITWGQTNQIVLGNSNASATNYIVPFSELEPNSYYYVVFSLEGNAARVVIYQMRPNFTVNPHPIFDSTEVVDMNTFPRREGRVGWNATLTDNDAYIESITPRHLNFAEFVSAPMISLTPVSGAQLYATYTPNTELWSGYLLGPSSTSTTASIERDNERSTTGASFRLTNFSGTNQGIMSNWMSITEFGQSGISFDLWYPGNLPGLKAKLVSRKVYEGGIRIEAPLTLPHLKTDQWQHVVIPLENDVLQTGEYALVIEQPAAGAGTWWVDNTSVFQRAVQWSARSVVDDAWTSNVAPWTDFREVVNTDTSGVLFPIRGKELQARAKALRQDAIISGAPKLKPRYAQLGRLVWPENASNFSPSASFAFFVSPPLNPSFIPIEGVSGSILGSTLVVNATKIIWANSTLEGFFEAPIGGGTSQEIPLTRGGEREIVNPSSICIDALFIYWTEGAHIYKVALAGGEPKLIRTETIAGSSISYSAIAVDGTNLYWVRRELNKSTKVEKVSIAKAAKGGEPLIATNNYIESALPVGTLRPRGLVANSTHLYYARDNKIYRAKLSETEPSASLLVTLPNTVFDLALNSTKVSFSYWTGLEYEAGYALLDGTSSVPNFLSAGGEEPPIAIDTNYLYYQQPTAIGRDALPGSPAALTYTFSSTSSEGSARLSSYFWEFGDGVTGSGSTTTHTYSAKGTYSVKLKVTDDNGLTSTKTTSLTF